MVCDRLIGDPKDKMITYYYSVVDLNIATMLSTNKSRCSTYCSSFIPIACFSRKPLRGLLFVLLLLELRSSMHAVIESWLVP
jgi:hypothetical protein